MRRLSLSVHFYREMPIFDGQLFRVKTKRATLLLFFLFQIWTGFSQKQPTQSPNIVPNPGFEQFSAPPIGWFYKGAHFGQVVRYWFSPTAASPDAYGSGISVPRDWREKGFGVEKPRMGKNMAGITVYGCIHGKPHCREYLSVLLNEPLVPGQMYGVEFWVNHLQKSLEINNLGMLFSEKAIRLGSDERITEEPQVKAEQILTVKTGRWTRVSATFSTGVEGEYLTIGNFDTDENTATSCPTDSCLNFSYYYIDEVKVFKIPPFLPIPVKKDDLSLRSMRQGETIALKDIYFEFDKHTLVPRSFVELKKLQAILQANPKMEIQILGHTDDQGTEAYNLVLSKKRAESVVGYLKERGIEARRLQSKGLGESSPKVSNETEEGRQENRRVEFVVLKM